MARFHVTITRPNPSNRFPLCFLEQARLIQCALGDLGHECTRRENRFEEDATNIVFSWHDWQGKGHPVQQIRDHECILYQGEQITSGGRVLPDWYFLSLKEARDVWDYSADNVTMFASNGLKVKHVPPAWHPSLGIDDGTAVKDIDVLFYGAMNLRRQFVLKQLGQICKTHFVCGVWGDERNELIMRSKIVLNVHFYESQTLELLRLAPLLANRIPVVSEASTLNPYGPDGIRMVPYRDIVRTVMELLRDDAAREKLGNDGYEAFRKTEMVDVVRGALEITCEISPAARAI